ncbi:MAG: FtsW/RodA/SpoVE family cell cycle protein [Elusimicrobia bacterium]|nr:FtsW/RodA/SpoVE family cell cycle protein [Elusimicrobiota bacterium]
MPKRIFMPFLAKMDHRDRSPWAPGFFGLDISLLVCCFLLFSLGTIVIYTALHGSIYFESLWLRHMAALTFAAILGLLVLFFPTALLAETSGALYAVSLVLLVLVLFFGKVIHGSKSWFDIGPAQFQPSEFAKLATILYLSRLQVRIKERDPWVSLPNRLKIFGAAAAPLLLVLAQNDLSSAIGFGFILFSYAWVMDLIDSRTLSGILALGLLTFVFLLAQIVAGLVLPDLTRVSAYLSRAGFGPGASTAKGLLWVSGFALSGAAVYRFLKGFYVLGPRATWLWALGLAVMLSAAWALSYGGYRTLKGYQKNRMVSFLFPDADPFGSGYNVTQSKIAIGSGGLVGQGILLGSQTSLGFLPERHTDFAFAALGETMGYVGCLGALALFSLLFWRLSRFAELARENWERLVAVGLFGLWFGEVTVNIAYVLGMFPILGIGLPFLSYGGSRLVVNGIEMGLLLSISRGFYVYR